MSGEQPKLWILWWWGAVLVGVALGYGMLHFVYIGDKYLGMFGFIAAPFVQGLAIAYIISKSKSSGSMGITGAVIVSSILLMWLLMLTWGEGAICIIMAAPLWVAFSLVGMLLGKSIARHNKGTAMAVGIIPLSLIGAYHLDNTIEPPQHYIQTTLDIDAKASD
ncbi:MAG: hypothetical protein ABIV13_06680, partial [Fimbriimonadales bacterium]